MAAIQAYAPVTTRYNTPQYPANSADQNRRSNIGQTPGRDVQQQASSTRSASLTTEYMASDKLYLQYTNKDGDSVVLNWERVEYQKAQITVADQGNTSDEQWGKIVDKILKEYSSFKDQVLKKFLDGIKGGSTSGTAATDQGQTVDTLKAADVPEEWNAENTSQRIVDFALSFFDGFKGAGEDFLKKIKDAIEAGFKQAGDIMGKLPGSVDTLIQDTHDLVMKKIDDWARAKGISIADQNRDGSTPIQQQPSEAEAVTA